MRKNPTTIVGIDCATQPRKIGLALGYLAKDKARIETVIVRSSQASILETVAGWVTHNASTLIALDAPLGWPRDLGSALSDHQAGDELKIEANELFRRVTDRTIEDKIGKRPLEVGADRIARTAHATLGLLQRLREKTGQEIPLAQQPDLGAGAFAIEVYPAATLKACGIETRGYKARDGQEVRESLLKKLETYINLPPSPSDDRALMVNNDDALDAAVCVLAGADFVRDEVIQPTDGQLKRAKKESWIWVRKPA